jgi:hypothetical protein
MIWLTWRQFRIQAWVALAVVAVLGAAVVATGPALHDLYRDSGLADCTSNCRAIADNFKISADTTLNTLLYSAGTLMLFLLPALVGVFWGAPLVARELETGTHRLVWNQTVSRGRWLTVKLVGIGSATVLTAGLISLAVTWWTSPLDGTTEGRLAPSLFSARGIVPIGYAVLALVAGVVIGMLVRRSVPAMALTLVFVAAVGLGMPYFVREHLATPLTSTQAFDPQKIQGLGIGPDLTIRIELEPPVQDSWVLENVTYGRDGKEFSGPVDRTACGRDGDGPQGCEKWLATQGLQQRIEYVPPSQFWSLQWREFGLLIGLTALLSLFCVWWIRRKVA